MTILDPHLQPRLLRPPLLLPHLLPSSLPPLPPPPPSQTHPGEIRHQHCTGGRRPPPLLRLPLPALAIRGFAPQLPLESARDAADGDALARHPLLLPVAVAKAMLHSAHSALAAKEAPSRHHHHPIPPANRLLSTQGGSVHAVGTAEARRTPSEGSLQTLSEGSLQTLSEGSFDAPRLPPQKH